MLSERILKINPSMTVDLTDKLETLKRKGLDIVKLNIGEPDFDTPQNVTDAAKDALDSGYTRYTQVSGCFELREAIRRKFLQDNNLEYSSDEIIVTTGAKQALVNALLSLSNQGDEVILVTPCWVSYIEMVKLSEATPIMVELEGNQDFKLDIDKIRKVITKRTKAILINTPNNPTGAVYSREELYQLGELAVKHDFYIISDEIYEKLIYDGAKHISVGSLSKEIKERTITINGFSKTYAMTGWRLGYAGGTKKIIRAMSKLQGHMTSGPNSIAQRAAIEALNGPQNQTKMMIEKYEERRSYLLNRLNSIDGMDCNDAKGAFYLMPNVSKFYGKTFNGRYIEDSISLADFLLDEALVAVVPGIAFHSPDTIRIAYCNSLENIEKGMDGIERALR